jgi:hypothetical protein
MTGSERELYQRAAADCHAIADGMDPEDCLSLDPPLLGGVSSGVEI